MGAPCHPATSYGILSGITILAAPQKTNTIPHHLERR